MTNKEIVEGQKIVAHYMGGMELTSEDFSFNEAQQNSNQSQAYSYEGMKYCTSWDWVIPVWIKFRKGWDGKDEKYGEWLDSLGWYLYSSDEPMRFFERLVYAIAWYNSRPNQQTPKPEKQ
jgi:hypothetical protein